MVVDSEAFELNDLIEYELVGRLSCFVVEVVVSGKVVLAHLTNTGVT